MNDSKYPVWKQWDGESTIVKFTSLNVGRRYFNGEFGNESDMWMPCDDFRWKTIESLEENEEEEYAIVYDKTLRGDGGSTSYYELPEGAKELSDLIYHKKMNHAVGEAFCALYRMNDNGEKRRNIKKVIRYMELELEQLGLDEQ